MENVSCCIILLLAKLLSPHDLSVTFEECQTKLSDAHPPSITSLRTFCNLKETGCANLISLPTEAMINRPPGPFDHWNATPRVYRRISHTPATPLF